MAVPVIDQTQGVLGTRAGEAIAFQPYATNSPTGWSAIGLPSGVSIDGSSGLVSGTPTTPGGYNFTLYATNGDGSSAGQRFFLGVDTGVASADVYQDLWMDIVTGDVWGSDPVAGTPSAPKLYGKFGDVSPMRIRFVSGNALVDMLTVNSVKLRMKEFEPDLPVVTADFWTASGSGASRVWKAGVEFDADALKGALAGYESDRTTEFSGVGEIEVVFGPTGSEFRRSSKSFDVALIRDIVANS